MRTKQSLAHFLLGRARAEVLSALLLRPDRPLHVRELARLTGTSPGSLHRELRTLEQTGLLSREAVGRNVLYRCNPRHPLFPELAGLLRKTTGLADVLRNALAPLGKRIEYAFVYGSVASGRDHPGSDVDLMLLGEVDLPTAVESLTKAALQLKREINPTPAKVRDFRERLQKDGFERRVLSEPRIWLIGDEDEFGELGADRAAPPAPADGRRGPAAPERDRPKSRRRRG